MKQNWLFEKINKIDRPLARLIRIKKKTKTANIRNKTGAKTTDSIYIKRIREYFKQL